MSNNVATDRGGKWILINPTKIISEKSFELTLTLETFVNDAFWRTWHVIMYAIWMLLSVLLAVGVVLET